MAVPGRAPGQAGATLTQRPPHVRWVLAGRRRGQLEDRPRSSYAQVVTVRGYYENAFDEGARLSGDSLEWLRSCELIARALPAPPFFACSAAHRSDEDVLAEGTACPDPGPGANVGEGPDAAAVADLSALIDDRRWMDGHRHDQ